MFFLSLKKKLGKKNIILTILTHTQGFFTVTPKEKIKYNVKHKIKVMVFVIENRISLQSSSREHIDVERKKVIPARRHICKKGYFFSVILFRKKN